MNGTEHVATEFLLFIIVEEKFSLKEVQSKNETETKIGKPPNPDYRHGL